MGSKASSRPAGVESDWPGAGTTVAAARRDHGLGLSYHYRRYLSPQSSWGAGLSLGRSSLDFSLARNWERLRLLAVPRLLVPTSEVARLPRLSWLGCGAGLVLPLWDGVDAFALAFRDWQPGLRPIAKQSSIHSGLLFGSEQPWALGYSYQREERPGIQPRDYEQILIALSF